MTNLEKYKDIFKKEIGGKLFCATLLELRTGKKEGTTDCDIRNCTYCIWDTLKWIAQEYTEPKKEFTQDELTILKNIDKKWKWIVRDKNNHLMVYTKKPTKVVFYWRNSDAFREMSLFNCFKQIQFEDSEPVFIDDYVNRK